jgi:2-methylcitrate dehydratase PrpD
MTRINGVTAATMVASRFTGVEDVFSGERGFFHAYGHYARPELLTRGLGREYDIMHDASRLRDPAVRGLRKRVELAGSRALSRAQTTQAIVEIVTSGGKVIRHHTKAVRGSATNPMSRDEVAAKARDLLVPVLGKRRAQRLIETVWNMGRVRDARELRPLLQAQV